MVYSTELHSKACSEGSPLDGAVRALRRAGRSPQEVDDWKPNPCAPKKIKKLYKCRDSNHALKSPRTGERVNKVIVTRREAKEML